EVAAPNETLIDAARDAVVRAGYEPVSGTRFAYGTLALKISRSPGARMSVAAVWSPYDGEPAEAGGARIAGPWWSVLPPLIAVLLALFYGQALLALALSVLTGALLVQGGDPLAAFWETIGTYL